MAKPKTPTIVNVADAFQGEGKLKSVGGSNSDTFNNILANQVVKTLWLGNADEEERDKLMSASLGALIGIAPKDELEGMLAAQMVAAHNAAMECYRRAMIPEQTHEGRKESLNQANKLSRTYTTLLEALNRHRGKGQQKVTVEHVHVHSGGQAIVGAVEASASGSGGGGGEQTNGGQPHAQALGHAPEPALWSQDPQPEPVPRTRDAERALPHARRSLTRRTQG